jgi:hypothetical protein
MVPPGGRAINRSSQTGRRLAKTVTRRWMMALRLGRSAADRPFVILM